MITGFCLKAEFQTGFRLLGLRSYLCASRTQIAADREQLDSGVIEADIDLVRVAEAHNVAVSVPLQPDFETIFGIERKIMVNCKPAPRPEREGLTSSAILDGR